MQKLNIEFEPMKVLKAAELNILVDKIDELVGEVNTLPSIESAIDGNKSEIDYVKDITEEELSKTIKKTEQSLTEAEKKQVRENIGAASMEEISQEYEMAIMGSITSDPSSILD